jgi:hypothetical protein
VKPFPELGGDLVDLFALLDLDGLVGGVQDDLAMLASSCVDANLFQKLRTELLVEVV